MGSRKVFVLFFGLVAVLALASSSYAVVIGDFEDAGKDGWAPAGGGTDSAPAAIGVTLNNGSLQVNQPQGGFWGDKTQNLADGGALQTALHNAQKFQFDETMIGTELHGGDGPGFSGFAQSNEISITLFSPGPLNVGPGAGNGLNLFGQQSFNAIVASDTKNHAAQWAGDDGTRTITWNIGLLQFDDPNIPGSQFKTIKQFMDDYPGINDAHIWMTAQLGNDNTATLPGRFYFDNVQLIVPEPATLVLIGLALPALIVAGRRKW